jgi:hypothetical protein
MASQLAENAEEKYQPSVELVSPADIRDNNMRASDADTAMDPEHESLAKDKAEKKTAPASFFGRVLGQAYSWLMPGRTDQENDNTKSSNDNDETTPDFLQVPAGFTTGRYECRSHNRFEDAEAASEYWLAFLGIFLILPLANTHALSFPCLLGQAQRDPGGSSLQKQGRCR